MNNRNPTTRNNNKIYKENPSNVKWFLLRSYNNGIEQLTQNLKAYNQQDLLVEIFEPQTHIRSIEDNKTKYQNFYPGYVLVAFDIEHSKEIDNIASLLLKNNNQLAEITAEEITKIRQKVLEFELNPQISLKFKTGDIVRITSGNYRDMEGNIVKINLENKTCDMDIQALGHSIRVTINLSNIESNTNN